MEIQQWEKENNFYIKKRATDYLRHSVLEQLVDEREFGILGMSSGSMNMIFVTGSSGCGKSALIHHVALELKHKGFKITPCINGASDISTFFLRRVGQCFVVDDWCGKTTINSTELDQWKNTFPRIVDYYAEYPKPIVFFSCRSNIFHDPKIQYAFDMDGFSKNRQVINLLSYKFHLTVNEKQAMLQSYNINDNCFESMTTKYDFFPLLCKMAHQSPNLQIQHLFDKPLQTIYSDIQDIARSESAHYCVFLLCFLFERFDVDWLYNWQNSTKPIEAKAAKTFTLEQSKSILQVMFRPNVLDYPGNPIRE